MANNDRVYEAYNGSLGEAFQITTHIRIEWIIEKVGHAQNILDIGCSQGIVSLLLAAKGKEVIGVDIQEEVIDFANDLLRKDYSDIQGSAKFICADFRNLSLNEKFDCVIVTEVIEHLDNPEEFLQKAASMLKPNGIILISTPFGVCLHPDHKATYYISNLTKLLEKSLSIKTIEFVESWMGAICVPLKDSDTFYTMPYFIAEEDEFEKREHKYIEKIEKLQQSFQLANDKYRAATQNYLAVKQWLTAKDEKLKASENQIGVLNQQLSEAKLKYKNVLENYELSKGWVSDRNEKLKEAEGKISALQETLERFKIVNQELQQELAKAELRLQEKEKENNMLMRQKDSLKEHEQLTEKELCSCLKDYDLVIMNTEQLMTKITRIEVQNCALVQKNNELQAKIDIIDNSRIGRLGIKLYHLYKKIMNR